MQPTSATTTAPRSRCRHRIAVTTMLALAVVMATTSSVSAQSEVDPPSPQGFDPANFSDPNQIDNEWVPMVPGTEFTWHGKRVVAGVVVPHTVMFTITDLVKRVDGVRATVIWERDFDSGGLSESELAFNAQDDSGKVWNLGEYPEVYEGGVLRGAPDTWIAGSRHALPGILMRSNPEPNRTSYSEGYSPVIEFYDRAAVLTIGGHRCVPAGCFDNVLEIDEWGPFAPEDGHQRKYYAPGVGPIYVTPVGGENEVLKLVKVEHLNAQQMALVREEALTLDRRGRHTNPIYAQTPAAHPRDDD